jgi:hypothetical protein
VQEKMMKEAKSLGIGAPQGVPSAPPPGIKPSGEPGTLPVPPSGPPRG